MTGRSGATTTACRKISHLTQRKWGSRQDLIELLLQQSMLVLTLPPSGPQPHFPTSFAKQSHFPPAQCTQCIFLSFPCPSSICLSAEMARREEWRDHVSRRLFCNLRASLHVDPLPKEKNTSTQPTEPTHTHLSPAWLMCPDTRTSPVNWPNELTTAPA